MKFTGKFIETVNHENFYEVEVDQEDGTVLAYTISESDLRWINKTNKSKWEIKYFASKVREI